MSENKKKKSKSVVSNEGLAKIISDNLKQLIEQNGTTQKDLATKVGVAEATMSDYCKGHRIPNAEFFVSLKKHYDISIDDFLTKSITPVASVLLVKENAMDDELLEAYQKYCGVYYVYYFDTRLFKGNDTQSPKDSVLFGVLFVYENPSSLDVPEFSCAAVLGVRDREKVDLLKNDLEGFKDPSKVLEHIASDYPETAYYGDFELSREHVFISLSHANTDKALLIFHRVNNKSSYSGGIGTVNSVSKGRERAPVVQFIGLSRKTLSMSAEEIQHSLLLDYPSFSAEDEAEEMVQTFKTLYAEPEQSQEGFSDYQKSIMVQSTLERFIKKSLERNMFRYGKISARDDDEWYHAIKGASTKDSE